MTGCYTMNFFKRIFTSAKRAEPEKDPDNTKLIFLLNNCIGYRSNTNYGLVMKELLEGNSFLILPSINGEKNLDGRAHTSETTKLKLSSAYNLDGLKVLGAFSDEKSLLTWAKKVTTYTALKSQAVFELCKEHNINRIVINSDSPNMFVVNYRNNSKSIDINEGVTIAMGTPAQPLEKKIIQNLVSNFLTIENILEAYQYVQVIKKEPSITIGLKLLSNSDNAKTAAILAVQKALADEPSKMFVDIFFLETEEWYDMVKNIEDALFYKKI